MKIVRFLPLLALLVLSFVAAACGSGDEIPSTTTTAAVQAGIPDGTHFGFIREVDEGTVAFDAADFLTSEAALEAARADGVIGPDEDLPNDFYLVNPDKDTADVAVASEATFALIASEGTDGLGEESVSFADFQRIWGSSDEASGYYGFVVGELPVTITVSDGEVTNVKQHYLP